jgi:hypothetical protein
MDNLTLFNYSKQKVIKRYFIFKGIKKEIVIEFLSYFFILLFSYAAIRKLIDFQMFKKEISLLFFIKPYAGFVLITVSFLEILVAFLLSISRFRIIGLICAFVLMNLFAGYLISVIEFTKVIPPHFGEIIDYTSLPENLIVTFFLSHLIIFNVYLYMKDRKEKTDK